MKSWKSFILWFGYVQCVLSILVGYYLIGKGQIFESNPDIFKYFCIVPICILAIIKLICKYCR